MLDFRYSPSANCAEFRYSTRVFTLVFEGAIESFRGKNTLAAAMFPKSLAFSRASGRVPAPVHKRARDRAVGYRYLPEVGAQRRPPARNQ